MTGGVLVGGRYRLEELIAEGGMGEVWRARDELLDRDVAVKLLREALASDPNTVERFRREARAAGSLSHPNMANVFDFVEGDDVPGIVMELVDGETLATRITRDAPMGAGEAVVIADAILDALHAAHQGGLIHRDVKPGNVILAESGRVKVTDFGIARAAGESTLTQEGTVLGSVHYVAPEQVRGEAPIPASDLFAVAVILYEMLTGRRPFEGDSQVAVAVSRLTTDPVSPRTHRPDLSPELESVIMRGLARDPAARYQSASEMRAALDTAATHARTARIPGSRKTRTTKVQRSDATMILPVAVANDAATTSFRREPEPIAPLEPARRMARILKPLWILITVGILTLLVMAFMNREPSSVRVRKLTGMSVDRAKALADDQGLVIGPIKRLASGQAAGTVLKQQPAAGAIVRRGAIVTLEVSTGTPAPPPCCKVPDLRGKTREQAEAELKAKGLELGDVATEESDAPHGTVIDQTPDAGVTLSPKAEVDIVIADNEEDRKGKGRGRG